MNHYSTLLRKFSTACHLILCVFFSFNTQAQVKLPIQVSNITVGNHTHNNQPFNARVIGFNKPVFSYCIDTLTGKITIQLRDKFSNDKSWKRTGNLAQLYLPSAQLKWAKTFDYQTDTLLQANSVMVQNSGDKSYAIDTSNGDIIWGSETLIKHIIPEINLGVGHRHNYSNSYQFFIDGIDLSTKNMAWSKSLIGSEKNSWKQDITLSNGAKLLNTENGLHAINLKTGEGWSYYALTSTSNQYLAAATAAGILFGAVGGIMVQPLAGQQVNNISSNALIYNNSIYYAFKDSIICLANDGSTIWRKSFPSNFSSTSKLMAYNGTVYMLNYGACYGGENYTSMFGKPFVAAINPTTGNITYLTKISAATKNLTPIDLCLHNDTLVILHQKKLGYFNAQSGELIKEKKTDSTLKQVALRFAPNNLYTQTLVDSNTYAKISDVFQNSTPIELSNQKIELTNFTSNIATQLNTEQFYVLIKQTEAYLFIANTRQTKVLNKQGKVVAELPISKQATFIGTKAYDIDKNNLIEVDLSEFAPN